MKKFWLVYHGARSVIKDTERIPYAEIFDDEIDANLRKEELESVHLENHIHDGYVFIKESTLGEKQTIDYIRLYM